MLNKVTENIWEAAGEIYAPMRIHFTCRMTVIRLPGGELLLHSPVKIDDPLAAELEKLGTVRYLVAPNDFHHMFLDEAISRYPDAVVYGAPGLKEKRRDLQFHHELGSEAPWSDTLDQVLIGGMPAFNEFVFLHKPSKTLIVTDLMFNIKKPQNLQSHIVLFLAGAYKKPGQSRLFRLAIKDKAEAGKSIRTLLSWDFERVIMAHGAIIEKDAKTILANAVRIMAKG